MRTAADEPSQLPSRLPPGNVDSRRVAHRRRCGAVQIARRCLAPCAVVSTLCVAHANWLEIRAVHAIKDAHGQAAWSRVSPTCARDPPGGVGRPLRERSVCTATVSVLRAVAACARAMPRAIDHIMLSAISSADSADFLAHPRLFRLDSTANRPCSPCAAGLLRATASCGETPLPWSPRADRYDGDRAFLVRCLRCRRVRIDHFRARGLVGSAARSTDGRTGGG